MLLFKPGAGSAFPEIAGSRSAKNVCESEKHLCHLPYLLILGGLPGLYSGTNAEFSKADSVIFRTDLYDLSSGQLREPHQDYLHMSWLESGRYRRYKYLVT